MLWLRCRPKVPSGFRGEPGDRGRLRLGGAQYCEISLQLPLLSARKNYRIESAPMPGMEAVIVVEEACAQIARYQRILVVGNGVQQFCVALIGQRIFTTLRWLPGVKIQIL